MASYGGERVKQNVFVSFGLAVTLVTRVIFSSFISFCFVVYFILFVLYTLGWCVCVCLYSCLCFALYFMKVYRL